MIKFSKLSIKITIFFNLYILKANSEKIFLTYLKCFSALLTPIRKTWKYTVKKIIFNS